MKTKSFLLLTSVLFSFSQAIAQKWEMKEAPLMTEWSKKIDIDNVLPEYPRPVIQRNEWKNLNGIWEFQEAQNGDKLPTGKRLKEKILVPFPWESAISGVIPDWLHKNNCNVRKRIVAGKNYFFSRQNRNIS